MKYPHRIARGKIEPRVFLLEVQKIFQTQTLWQICGIPKQLARLIVAEAAAVNGESQENGPVKEVGLGKAELILRLTRAALQNKSQRFTEAKEIVG